MKSCGLAVLFAVMLVLSPLAAAAADEVIVPEPARAADSFVESIGVATHFGYHNTVYGQKWDEVSKLLGESGIRLIRDGYDPHLDDLWKSYGIRSILIAHPSQTWDACLEQWKQHRQLIAAIEGPNEVNGRWDNLHNGYEGTTWPDGPKRFQNELFDHVKGEAQLKDIRVIDLSLWNKGAGPQIAPLRSFDYANAHSYAGGGIPSQSMDFRDPYLVLGRGAALPPLVATESGYHTCIGNSKVIAGAQAGVSHAAHRKYIPRQVAEYFAAGYRWDVIYEFAAGRPKKAEQEDPEAAFGLLMPDAAPKPAYFALKSLIELIGESKWDAAAGAWVRPVAEPPRALAFSLGDAPASVHHTLLERADGTFQLLLWNEVSSWDLRKKRDVANDDVPVHLALTRNAEWITVSHLGPDAPPVQQVEGVAAIDLKVPDEVIVVGIKPAAPPMPGPINAPSGIAATSTPNAIELTWPASPAAAAYWVSLNQRNLGKAEITADGKASFKMNRLIPATTYNYEIVAVSRDGAISAPAKISAITVDAFPDLIVRSLKAMPETPKEGDAISFAAVIANIGNTATEDGVTIGTKFQVDNKTVCWCDNVHGPLAPGQEIEAKPNNGPAGATGWVLTRGTHYVTAIADDMNRIVESNKANNKLTITVSSGVSPHLVVKETKVMQAQQGKPLIVDVVLANQGTDAIAKGMTVSANIRDADATPAKALGFAVSREGVPVDGTITLNVTCESGLIAGKHKIQVIADDLKRIPELDRSNGQVDVDIDVAGP